MANFSTTTKHAASEFNGGIQYTKDDQFSLEALNASIENGLYAANKADDAANTASNAINKANDAINKANDAANKANNKTAITYNDNVISEIKTVNPIAITRDIDWSYQLSFLYEGVLHVNANTGRLYVSLTDLAGDGLIVVSSSLSADLAYISSNIAGNGLYSSNAHLHANLAYIGSNIAGEGLYFDSDSNKLSVDTSNLSSSISSNLPNYSYVASGSVSAKVGYLTNIKALHSGHILYNGSNWIELSMYIVDTMTTYIWGFMLQSSNDTSGQYIYDTVTPALSNATLTGGAVVTLDKIQPARTE